MQEIKQGSFTGGYLKNINIYLGFFYFKLYINNMYLKIFNFYDKYFELFSYIHVNRVNFFINILK